METQWGHDLIDHESRAPLLTTEKVLAWVSKFKAPLVPVTLVNKNPEVIQNERSIKSGSRCILEDTVVSETTGGVCALVTRSASRTALCVQILVLRFETQGAS